MFRTAASLAAGLFVIAGAYKVCFAQGGGVDPVYGGGGGGGGGNGGNGEDDGGLSGLEIAGIAVGGAAVIALAAGAFSGGAAAGAAGAGMIPIGGTQECKEQYEALPQDQNRIAEIRLTPSDTQIKAGYARCFYVNVLTTEDNKKWYSVTQRAETRIELQDPDICLVKMDGTKNIFMVPASTPKSCDGKVVTLVATFSPPGQSPYTATAKVRIRVPNQ